MTVLRFSGLLRPIAGLALVPVLLLGPSTAAQATLAEDDDPEVVHHSVTVTDDADAAPDQRAVLDYWTPERMATATPVAALLDDVSGRLPLTPGPRSHTSAPHPATSGSAERWTGGGRVAETTGKVFMTMHGRDLSCSASVVSAENAATVISAGHCLKDGTGDWAERWVFVPGYAEGERPHGTFVARDLYVTGRWANDADDSADVGMAVLHPNDEDVAVADAVGAQNITFSSPEVRHVHAFGFPADGRFDGEHLYFCSGQTTPDTRSTSASGMACQMTRGSSGGPWLTDFDPETGRGSISSVISFKYADDPNTQYGPPLGTDVRRMHAQAELR
ncbi:serine protease [Lipingzhangella sp. LS1_29]|uniref:Serine protease n=1 Tax=Lipingzhangella rawalii TaxID=2055835 RepID=A0ABU2HCB8_9ACTN|nr:serine protease [Lipingzhangella rawalii]MDS1272499.1 serine protease [Lipingzhangella rawalii]